MLLPPVQSYLHALHALTATLQGELAGNLLGVYLFGSAAQEAYEPGLSDLDVQAVVWEALPLSGRPALAARLTHTALPCPARQLEFVLYSHAAVQPMTARPALDLKLNTGAARQDHAIFDIARESPHWFVLDIAQGREVGQALFGPPPREVSGEVPRSLVLAALGVSHAWHAKHDCLTPNRVLNTARAWRYVVTGEWGPREAGVRWARARPQTFPVLERAWRARHMGKALEEGEMDEFMTFFRARLEDAGHSAESVPT